MEKIPSKVRWIIEDALLESDDVQIVGRNAEGNVIFKVDCVEYEIILKKEKR